MHFIYSNCTLCRIQVGFCTLPSVGKSFGCVDMDVECKIFQCLSISGGGEGVGGVAEIVNVRLKY